MSSQQSKTYSPPEKILPSAISTPSEHNSVTPDPKKSNRIFDEAKKTLIDEFRLDDSILESTLFSVYSFLARSWKAKEIETWNSSFEEVLQKVERSTRNRIVQGAISNFETVFPKSVGRSMQVLESLLKIFDSEESLEQLIDLYFKIFRIFADTNSNGRQTIIRFLQSKLKSETFERFEFAKLASFPKSFKSGEQTHLLTSLCSDIIESDHIVKMVSIRPLLGYLPEEFSAKYYDSLSKLYLSEGKVSTIFDSFLEAGGLEFEPSLELPAPKVQRSDRKRPGAAKSLQINLDDNSVWIFKKRQKISAAVKKISK